MDNKFILASEMQPRGDQPQAIEKAIKNLNNKVPEQIVLGATGTGKTFTIAKIVESVQRPTLVLAHNKTLAAQLCTEFQHFFPNNAVSYFVSYYDYYQPEAYIASTDTYIEKDSSINKEIEKFRHAATMNLLTRRDVLIVASVSCIYGLGSVEDYQLMAVKIKVGEILQRDKLLRKLTDIQYVRSSTDFSQGMFHVFGDTVDVISPSSDNMYRIEFFGDEIEKITECELFTGEVVNDMQELTIFPAKHAVVNEEKVKNAIPLIEKDLAERVKILKEIGKPLEAHRLQTRTEYDMDMLRETGYCSGIENYTRYFSNREAGSQPCTLMDYLPDDFLLVIDESHISVPQIGGMHNGNLSRKKNLVEHGFRLPSCYDNRPLTFEEFEGHMKSTMYVSATPGKYELAKKELPIIELINRPTGLIDPTVEVRPKKGQIDHVMTKISETIDRKEKVLLTTLTKKSAEDLTDFLREAGVRVRYLHSEIDTIERIEILRDLCTDKFDVLVGINLLREGLDLPQVSFIGILDADKQGFLRSRDALIQTIGRAARNVNGNVTLYADKITAAMEIAISETERRREIQMAYNKKHGIEPKTIIKEFRSISLGLKEISGKEKKIDLSKIPADERNKFIESLETQMELAVTNMEFEKAAELRDEIEEIRKMK